MADIVTVTLFPTQGMAMSCHTLLPSHKLCCGDAQRFPGAGGIHAARLVPCCSWKTQA